MFIWVLLLVVLSSDGFFSIASEDGKETFDNGFQTSIGLDEDPYMESSAKDRQHDGGLRLVVAVVRLTQINRVIISYHLQLTVD